MAARIRAVKGKTWFTAVWFLTLILVHGLFGQVKETGVDKESLRNYVTSICKKYGSGGTNKKTVAFFLRFEDFGCLSCFENFIEFCDSLEMNFRKFGNERTLMIFQRNEDEEEKEQKRLLMSWAKANNLRFPIYMVPSNEFEKYSVTSPSVVLVDGVSSVKFIESLPLPFEIENRILNDLFPRRGKKN